MLPNMILILHPQLKHSLLTMSGSRRCPSFSHLAPCLAWRNPDSVVFTGQPWPVLSRPTGQCYVLRPHVVLKTGQNLQLTIKWQTSGRHWRHTHIHCVKYVCTVVNLAVELWLFTLFLCFLQRPTKGQCSGQKQHERLKLDKAVKTSVCVLIKVL